MLGSNSLPIPIGDEEEELVAVGIEDHFPGESDTWDRSGCEAVLWTFVIKLSLGLDRGLRHSATRTADSDDVMRSHSALHSDLSAKCQPPSQRLHDECFWICPCLLLAAG